MGTRLEKGSDQVRKRIEGHTFSDEGGEEYGASKFGGFTDYLRRKKIKLQNLDAELRSQTADNPRIFRGIVAYVNGYTQPSLNDLHNLIVSHGGGFLQYLDGKTAVTHVIASALTPKKKVEFARYRIVKPAWVVDSVREGRLLPWDAYRVVDEGVKQKVLVSDKGNIVSQANSQRQGYRDQTDTSWYTSQVRQQAGNVEAESSNDGVGLHPSTSVSGLGFDGEVNESMSRPRADHSFRSSHARVSDYRPETTPDAGDVDAVDSELDFSVDSEDDGELMKMGDSAATRLTAMMPGTAESVEAVSEGQRSKVDRISAETPIEKKALTAEEHNAILLSNPHMAKSSTANPDFINQYYRESRLHHLSTWKADLKAQLQARAQEKSSSQKARQKRVPGARRYIMHVDFDSFFAAVSLRKNPHLIDKVVVIAHGSGPGSEIASCNYPARKYGIKNGMWMKTALGLCPDIKVLPYDFKLYEEASKQFYDSILSIEGIVQSISIDEALIDVSDLCIQAGGSDGKDISEGSIYREQEKASQLAEELREAVRTKTGCDVSVGIGNNILLAKVALRKAKPAGQHLIKPEDILAFIGDLMVTDLPGVAWSIGNKLEEIGVKFVKDIRNLTKERLTGTLGPKTGEKLWEYSRGIDRQEVGEQVIRKSVSAEINWGIRFLNQQQAEEFVQCLCDELSKRLLEQLVKGRQLTMKIMRKAADAGMDPPKNLGHGKCDTFNKSIVLGVATHDKAIIGKEAISVLRSYGFSPGELRGLGVQMQKLEPLRPAPAATSTAVDSSQRRLQFKKPVSAASPDPAPTYKLDGAMPPPRPKHRVRLVDNNDTIEEVPTPEKERKPSVIEGALQHVEDGGNSNAIRKPLNVAGTQFLLPTQVDPSVLAELPPDIRSKLAPKQKSMLNSVARSSSPGLRQKSRSASPHISDGEYGLPNQSQLDPDIFAELPEDVKQELLSHYRKNGESSTSRRLQQVLPQSPRKARQGIASKKLVVTPTKKQKFSSILSRARSNASAGAASTLTQSNFVSMAKASGVDVHSGNESNAEVSQSFLDELPEDIRLEIVAEQRRQRLISRSGLNVEKSRRRAKAVAAAGGDNDAVRGQQRLSLPAQPARPTFTSRKLSTLAELRIAMEAWVQEFSGDDEDGPYHEDVAALGGYLKDVILQEKDMEKAVAVLRWLSQVIEMQDFDNGVLLRSWEQCLDELKGNIQDAVRHRGLPPLDFG